MNHPARIAPVLASLSAIALLAVLYVAVGAAPASAQTLRIGGGSLSPGGGPRPSGPHRLLFHPGPPTVVSTPPGVVYQPRFLYSVPARPDSVPYRHVPHHSRPIPYGPAYVPGPYLAPSYGEWVPGYWAYTWVPQSQAGSAWVPGYYDKDGVWVAGYFATQATQSGYYQPYWVRGYWAP
jgi:hypothetical protein